MPSQTLQQLPHGPIVRNRIRDGHNRTEPKDALLITLHDSASVRLVPAVVVLHVVFAVAVRFPHVDLDAGDGRAGGGFDGAEHEEGRAGWVGGDGGARREGGGVVGVEGTEDGAFG